MEILSHLHELSLSCPICYVEFGEEINPFVLPCGHNVCNFCLKKLKKTRNNDDDNDDDMTIKVILKKIIMRII